MRHSEQGKSSDPRASSLSLRTYQTDRPIYISLRRVLRLARIITKTRRGRPDGSDFLFCLPLYCPYTLTILPLVLTAMAPSKTPQNTPRITKTKSLAKASRIKKKNELTQEQKAMRAARNKRYYDKKKLYETLLYVHLYHPLALY